MFKKIIYSLSAGITLILSCYTHAGRPILSEISFTDIVHASNTSAGIRNGILNFKGRSITNLEGIEHYNFSNINHLILSNNSISSLDALVTANTNTVLSINLSGNKIKNIDHNTLQRLNSVMPNLMVLDLRSNPIENIPAIVNQIRQLNFTVMLDGYITLPTEEEEEDSDENSAMLEDENATEEESDEDNTDEDNTDNDDDDFNSYIDEIRNRREMRLLQLLYNLYSGE